MTLQVMVLLYFFTRTLLAGFCLYHSPCSQTVLQRYNNTNSNGIDINTYVDQNSCIRDTDISPHTYRLMFIFLTKKLRKHSRIKCSSINQWDWSNWMAAYRRMKIYLDLSSYTKVYSRWI